MKAVSEGKREFSRIAVVGAKGGGKIQKCPPCGVCRQFLYELCGGELEVILSDGDGDIETYTLSELLPESFSHKNIMNR